MRLQKRKRWIFWAAALLIFLGVLLWNLQVYHMDVGRSRDRAFLNAKVYAEEVGKDFQRGISISETLKAMLIDSKGQINSFDHVARNLMEDYIGSIQLAPGGVVNAIYPLGGNEGGMIDLLNDPLRGPISNYGKEHDIITMQGPFDLAQGGQGIAIRNPVFLPDEEGEQQFWGFSIVIIKSPEIFHESLSALQSFGYEYTLDTKNVLSDQMISRVAGSIPDGETLTNAVEYTFEVAGNEWRIRVLRDGSWATQRSASTAIVTVLLALLIIALIYLILRQREQGERLRALAVAAESANTAKTNFLSNMAHDLRTPLNAVIGLAELAGKHKDDREKADYYIGQISVAGKQLLQIINGILEITRIESDKVDINEAVTDSEEIFGTLKTLFENQASESDIRFNFSYRIKHRYLYSDRRHVEEILTNLVSNAMKYTQKDGCVDVAFSELPGEDEEHVIIRSCVKDNGIGMSEEFQQKVFGKFEREDNEIVSQIQGSGLGLSIVKKLVDIMGGTIEISSRQGLGTLITVELPHRIAPSPDGAGEEETADKSSDMKTIAKKRILLAEDNDINAMIAEDILSDEGLLVERAVDGGECVRMLREAPEDYYDLILMDLNMPLVDGFEATKMIRAMDDKKKASILIIAMTANAFEEDRQRAIEAGMDDHLAKPVDTTLLFSMLHKYIQ